MHRVRMCFAAMMVALAAARVSSAPKAAAAVDQSGVSRTDVSAQAFAGLTAKVKLLEEHVARQEDIEAIRELIFSYGYYMDNGLYDQVLTLMSDKIVSCEVGGYGVYVAKDGCTRFWKGIMGPGSGGNENRIFFGKFIKHHLVKDVITIEQDGNAATARVDYIGVGGTFQPNDKGQAVMASRSPSRPGFQFGVYSLNFVKEDGIWKIGKFWLHFDTSGFLTPDWSSNPGYRCASKMVPPDMPSTTNHPFPEVTRIPFQYPNPVTGELIPGSTDPTHYWIGNWPGEFGKECGHR